jgi:hypothetical protein
VLFWNVPASLQCTLINKIHKAVSTGPRHPTFRVFVVYLYCMRGTGLLAVQPILGYAYSAGRFRFPTPIPRIGASRRKECHLFNNAVAYSGGRLRRVSADSRSQTVYRNDFLILVPTLGTWICLQYTRTLRQDILNAVASSICRRVWILSTPIIK